MGGKNRWRTTINTMMGQRRRSGVMYPPAPMLTPTPMTPTLHKLVRGAFQVAENVVRRVVPKTAADVAFGACSVVAASVLGGGAVLLRGCGGGGGGGW